MTADDVAASTPGTLLLGDEPDLDRAFRDGEPTEVAARSVLVLQRLY